jgi:hypothetical protein
MRFLLFTLTIFMMTHIGAAQARDVVQCGAPKAASMPTQSPYDFCNIYSRRAAYIGDYNALHDNIMARAENYNNARERALKAYEGSVSAEQTYEAKPHPTAQKNAPIPMVQTYHSLAQ